MVAVRIPGADSIDPVAPARDPGVRADPSDFGADIGVSMEHFGAATVALGAHLYQKQQDAADQVAVDRATVQAPAVVRQTIEDTQKQFPEGGPEVTPALQANLEANLGKLRQQQAESGLTLSPKAAAQVDHHFAGLTAGALTQGVVYGTNQHIKALGDHFDDSVNEIGSQALADPASIDTQLAALDKSADAYRDVIPRLQLEDKLDKAKKGAVLSAINGYEAAGKYPEAQALRARFFGSVPKADIYTAIYGQESGGGRNTTTSVTGARGGMQIQPATFAQYANPGESIDNPADNRAVGKRIIDDLSAKSGGDPARIAVGYFSGPGNIAPPDSPTPWKVDKADPTGKTVSSYVSDIMGRMGRSVSGKPELPDPVLAINTYNRLNSAQNVQSAKYHTLLKNDIASISNTGKGNPDLTADKIASVAGQDKATEWMAERAKAQQFWTQTQGYYTQPPSEISANLAALAPKPGAADYIEQAKTYAAATKVAAAAMKQRTDDPAAYAAGYMPAVQTATAKMNAAEAGTDDAAKISARSDYATAQLAEQGRLGIPPDQQKILPQSYIENFQNKLSNPGANGGAGNIAAQIQNEAAMWGDKWPLVYKQLSKELEPAALVIGSGVKPQAAQKLAELANTKFGDLIKDEDAEKSATIKKDTLDAFKPFAESMVGNEGSVKLFNDFVGQGQKLAAYYVTRGQSSSQAAAKAYDDLIGSKYEIRDGYRIPKALPYTASDIQAGAVSAKFDLGKMDILPEADNFGGLSKDYLKDQTIKAYQRDGKWVNAPDESGLMLVYADAAVRKTDGKPVIIPWDELGGRGKAVNGIKPDPFSGAQP